MKNKKHYTSPVISIFMLQTEDSVSSSSISSIKLNDPNQLIEDVWLIESDEESIIDWRDNF